MAIGFSFQPGLDAQQAGGATDQPFGQGRSAPTPQQAVNILSLPVPKTLPSNAPVNRSLLTSPGSAAPGASGLTSLVQALLQAFQPQAPMGSPQMPMAPDAQAPQAPQSAPMFPSQAPQPTAPPFDFTGDALGPPANPVATREGTDPTLDPSLAPGGRNQTLWSKYHDQDPITQYLWNNASMDPFGGFGNFRDAPPSLGARFPSMVVDNDPLGGGNRA